MLSEREFQIVTQTADKINSDENRGLTFEHQNFSYDEDEQLVTRKDGQVTAVKITWTEAKILGLLLRIHGKVATHAELAEVTRNPDEPDAPSLTPEVLKVHISRLRKAIDPPGIHRSRSDLLSQTSIRAVQNEGYFLRGAVHRYRKEAA